VAKKIGTSNGEFEVKSNIYVEMSEEAPTDALPCGFEGYGNERICWTQHLPFVPYKTKYNYTAGEILYNHHLVLQVEEIL
jgi:hypothetical protein